MKLEKFYLIQSKLLSSTIQAHLITIPDGGRESMNKLLKGHYEDFNFPLIFKHKYGTKLRDILDTGWVSIYLISNRLRSFLIDNKFKGWETFQIDLRARDNSKIEGYFGLAITGKCGSVDYTKSEILEKQLVQGAPKLRNYLGLHIGLEKWDGSDIFTPDKHLGIIVTNELREKIEKGKFTNIHFVNLVDVETPIINDHK